MRIKLIDIGNSKGIRFPQALIREYNLSTEINLELKKDGILITPTQKPRSGWEEMFKEATVKVSLEEKSWIDATNNFDEEEWAWK